MPQDPIPSFDEFKATREQATAGKRSALIWGAPRKNHKHQGEDFGGQMDSPVGPPDDGEVVFAGPNGNMGNTVAVRHRDGVVTRYGHLNKINVAVGERVAKGSQLGLLGQTGNAKGPHVHYEVIQDALPIDPASSPYRAPVISNRARQSLGLRSPLGTPPEPQQPELSIPSFDEFLASRDSQAPRPEVIDRPFQAAPPPVVGSGPDTAQKTEQLPTANPARRSERRPNSEDAIVGAAVKNPEKLIQDLKWHFGPDAPELIKQLSPKQKRQMVLFATQAALRDEQKKATGLQLKQSPAYQNEMRARIGLKPLATKPEGMSIGDLRRAEDWIDPRMGVGELRRLDDRVLPPPLTQAQMELALKYPSSITSIVQHLPATRGSAAEREVADTIAQRIENKGSVLGVIAQQWPAFLGHVQDIGAKTVRLINTAASPGSYRADHLPKPEIGLLNDVSDYLANRAEINKTIAAYEPPNLNLPEKVARTAIRQGYNVAQIAATVEATGLSLPTVMVGESIILNSDKDPETQAKEAAKAYAFGTALTKLPGLAQRGLGKLPGEVGRVITAHPEAAARAIGATGFGTLGLAEAKQRGAESDEVIAETIGGALIGGGLAGGGLKRIGERLRAVPDVVIAADRSPEWLRQTAAKATGKRPVVVQTEGPDPRFASVYANPETNEYISREVTPAEASRLLTKDRSARIVPDAQFDILHPRPPAEPIAPTAPLNRQLEKGKEAPDATTATTRASNETEAAAGEDNRTGIDRALEATPGVEVPPGVSRQGNQELGRIEPKQIVRHSDPNIDGGEVLGRAGDGRLQVRNKAGGISLVQDPRKQGNREAALIKESTPASEDAPTRAEVQPPLSTETATAQPTAVKPVNTGAASAASAPSSSEEIKTAAIRQPDGTIVAGAETSAALQPVRSAADATFPAKVADPTENIDIKPLREENALRERPTRAVVEPEIRKPRPATRPVIAGAPAAVKIPGTDRTYQGRYAVREVEDVVPSHNAQNFQPNSEYFFTNDRRYDRESQYQKQVIDRSKSAGPEAFEPTFLINNSPTAETGPPIIDRDGNVLGGNSRGMIIHRVYASSDTAPARAYRKQLLDQATVYGLDPQKLAAMKRPVLVRELDDAQLLASRDAQKAITELNVSSTTALTQEERAISSAQQISPETADYLARKIESEGEDATLAKVMDSYGVDIINRLIAEGVFTGGERNSLLKGGKATLEAKSRVEKMLVGRVYRDLAQMEATVPVIRRNIERIVAPTMKVQGTDWDISEPLKGAIDALNEARAAGMADNLDEFQRQDSMIREPYTNEEIALAKTLQLGPRKTAEKFRAYANDYEMAAGGGGLFGAPVQSDSFDLHFGGNSLVGNTVTGNMFAGSGRSALGEPDTGDINPRVTAPDPIVSDIDPEEAHAMALSTVRMPVSENPEPGYEKSRVSAAEVIKSYEAILSAVGRPVPIRSGRISQRSVRGIYKPHAEIIRLVTANNIPTAAHETGHALQKVIYGSTSSLALVTPGPVKRELVNLGKALYGSRKPNSGYRTEGFAEFLRYYLTRDDVSTVAPATLKHFEENVLTAHPEIAKGIENARGKTDAYRKEGAKARSEANIERLPGMIARGWEKVTDAIQRVPKAWIDEFTPLFHLSELATERRGSLQPSNDPAILASALRATAGAKVAYMVNEGMIDFAGNVVGPPLKDATAVVRGRQNEFSLYLHAKRAQERWSKGKNPGMSQEDADSLVTQLETPEFQMAAQRVYDWNDGILSYVEQAVPSMAPAVEQIRAQSSFYVPLQRAFAPEEVKGSKRTGGTGGNALKKMKGSGRAVKEIFPQILQNAEQMLSTAHKRAVLEAVVKLSEIEGLGYLVEEVPRERVPVTISAQQAADALKQLGYEVDESMQDEMVTFFTPSYFPKGQTPIVPIMRDGTMRWYQVEPEVYNTLAGLDLYRLHPLLDMVFGLPTRVFRLGVTGLRPAFSLLTNPMRDVQTFIMQTKSEKNPAHLTAIWFAEMAKAFDPRRLGSKRDPFLDLFDRLGAQVSQPLGVDIATTRKVSKGLFHGRVMNAVRDPVNLVREFLSLPETVSRTAELRAIADEIGWRPGQPMTTDQALEMTLAAKRVTTDFSAGGHLGKVMNQAVPFFNAAVQGGRTFTRTFKENPRRSILRGLLLITIPSLLLWWKNKDKEWYRDMPDRERFMYWNIEAGNQLVRIPKAFEWGNLFAVAPEALFDSWYQKDPEGVRAAVGHIFETATPDVFPVVFKAGKEQWQNRIEFFDKPIVPRGELDLPPGEQRGPYTSAVATWLGRRMPDRVSPRRVDALIRSIGGGVAPDVLNLVGLGGQRGVREYEASDLPVVGRAFRPGGIEGMGSKTLDSFYDQLSEANARANSKDKPETPEQRENRLLLDDANKAIQVLRVIQMETPELKQRQDLARIARVLAATAQDQRLTPEDRVAKMEMVLSQQPDVSARVSEKVSEKKAEQRERRYELGQQKRSEFRLPGESSGELKFMPSTPKAPTAPQPR